MRLRLPAIALVGALSACAPTRPDMAHVFTDPPVRAPDRETVTRTRTGFVAAPPYALLDWIMDVPLEDVFAPYGSIPAVSGTRPLSPNWPEEGARRRVLLADGHQAAEIILSVEGTTAFTYQVWGFTNAAGGLAEYAIGRFEVIPAEGGSQLNWSYAFAPRSRGSRVLLSVFVATQWSGYMTAAFANLTDQAERAFAASDLMD